MKILYPRQTIFLLTTIWGSLTLIPDTYKERGKVADALNSFKNLPDIEKIKRWVRRKNKEWTGLESPDMTFHPAVLATMASNTLEDMLDHDLNSDLRSVLVPVRDSVVELSLRYGEVDEFEQYEEAGRLVEELYQVIGMRRD